MDLWHPPSDQPHLLEWWRPLLIASRNLRKARFPWPIHLDEMVLTGRVDRGTRPAIWVYKHAESRGELYLDATGQAYKFTRTPNAKSLGRFTACALDSAVWRAGMPSFVQPMSYEEPPSGADEDDDLWTDDEPLAHPASPRPTPRSAQPRRRGHLTVIDGGLGTPPLAG
jgi:hypothetical protein